MTITVIPQGSLAWTKDKSKKGDAYLYRPIFYFFIAIMLRL